MSCSAHPSQAPRGNQTRSGPARNRGATATNAQNTAPTPQTTLRYNPLRGAPRTTLSGVSQRNVGAAGQGINPNMFAPENMPDPGNINRHINDVTHLDNFDNRLDDEEDLYESWPPLRDNGALARPLEELEKLMELDDSHVQLVQRILQSGQEGQWRGCVILMASILNQLRTSSETILPEISVPNLPIPPPHVYSSTVKSFLRRKIRELLTVANLEAYSRGQTVGGIPLTQTPLVMLHAHLEGQSEAFKKAHLPVDWPRNHVSSQSVLALMRVLLKHERGSLRNLLLTNVKQFGRRSIDGPVPSLMELILIIDRAMGARDELRSPEVVAQAYNTPARVRMAYLRLEVIHHFLNPDPANNLTQWEIIDRKLEALRRQSEHYRNAFARLIVDTDRALFGEVEFSIIPKLSVVIPTDTDVEAEMLRSQQIPNRRHTHPEEINQNHPIHNTNGGGAQAPQNQHATGTQNEELREDVREVETDDDQEEILNHM